MALKDTQQGLFDSEIERLLREGEECAVLPFVAVATSAPLDPFAAGGTTRGSVAGRGEGSFSWRCRGDFGSADLGLNLGQVEVDYRGQVERDQLREEQAADDAEAEGAAGFASGSLAHRTRRVFDLLGVLALGSEVTFIRWGARN
jgi:hypothetical protein